MLLEGWEQSTHEIIGRAVDSLSPGSSGDQKARLVLGLVAWENAKGKRVCQQRVRDTRKSLRGALNKCLKAKRTYYLEYEEVVTVSLLRPKRTYYLCVVRETYLLFVLSRRTLV